MARNHKPADPRGGHVRIYWEIIDSMAWRAVTPRTQSLYVLMRRRLTGNSNGNISATLGEMKAHGWNASATLSKALRELQSVGLIAVTRQGGIAFGRQVCTLYRFTDEPMHEWPKLGISALGATNEWRAFQTLSEAQQAVKVHQT